MYDLIIIGAGPAAYTASIYASRYKIKNLIIGREHGGQIAEAHLVENYPGFLSIDGKKLMDKFKEHAEKFEAEIITKEVQGIIKEKDNTFTVDLEKDGKYSAKTILLATGMGHRKLAIPGEEKFIGKGVSFCFTCDGMFFKDKTVAVAGGSDSAAMAADYMSKIAKKVYLIFRKDNMTAEPVWQEKIKTNPKIEIVSNTNITEIKGNQKVEEITLDTPYKEKNELLVDGVFIEIGSLPSLALPKELGLKIDKFGYVKVSEDQSTNIKGIFAAGDITTASNKFRQVITAASEGSIAVSGIYKYLQKK
ncbi:FAD-dependent oxidoreductase [Candidatus Falkowbacteria bacterium]|jgi:thioredoxin reductase (NADPH)|nr:FAD-dependent oxidoreductase [Candidatus Falkowbacteria bacterium]MBT4432754.1 FAD-dependent oxidoreductase [Candidatus Falkowbacteria bacterium]